MKKLKKLTIFIMFGIFMAVFFVGCSALTTAKLKKHTAEMSKTFFVTRNEDFYISLCSGQRESNYKFDGETTDMIDFTLITLTFPSPRIEQEFSCKIKINDNEYDATLIKNPYKSNYMCDLKKEIAETDNISITFDEVNYVLECKSKDFNINYEKAMSIAINSLKNDAESILKDKNQKYECYLKILYKPEVCDNFYWYFMIKTDVNYINVVIDSITGEILAQY